MVAATAARHRERPPDQRRELLASGETEAFGVFYDRHVHTVLGYFARRTGDASA